MGALRHLLATRLLMLDVSTRFLVFAVSALPLAAQPLQFQDITATCGITWVQTDIGSLMGAGGAFLDYDGDGWQDILLTGGATPPSLYRNLGGATFVLVAQFPIAGANETCVAVADIDNDGDPDFFLGAFGKNRLFRNDGGAVFTNISTLDLSGDFDEWTAAAAFGDFDNDGNVDLYVGNYIDPPPLFPNHMPRPNRLFQGNGDGTFVEITNSVTQGAGTALAVTWTDYDNDGDPDLFIGNDFGDTVAPNRLLRNDRRPGRFGDWIFTDVSVPTGFDIGFFCMGIAIGDIDRDQDFDYYFTNLGTNALLRNDDGVFSDVADATGTELTYDLTTPQPLLATSWGCGFYDFDSDGWLDLYVSNGHIPAAPQIANGLATPNGLFHHDGPSMTYTEVAAAAGVDDDGIGRGCAFADIDNDGDIDILQCNVMGPPLLLRNDTPNPGGWFQVGLVGERSNRDALGARLEIDTGEFVAIRELSRNHSFESSSESVVHFGLGAGDVRRLGVRWPSGTRQELFDLPVDSRMELVEPKVVVTRARAEILPSAAGGWELVATGLLVNQTDELVPVRRQAQFRFAYDPAPLGPPGGLIWSSALAEDKVPAGSSLAIRHVEWLGTAQPPDNPIRVDFVWQTTDFDGGIDMAKTPLRKGR